MFVHHSSHTKTTGQLWVVSVLPVDSWDGIQVARLFSKHPNSLSHLTSPWFSLLYPHLSIFNSGFLFFYMLGMWSPGSSTMSNKYSELATKLACVLLLDEPWPLQPSFLQDRNHFITLPEKVNNLAGNVTQSVMLHVSSDNEANFLR